MITMCTLATMINIQREENKQTHIPFGVGFAIGAPVCGKSKIQKKQINKSINPLPKKKLFDKLKKQLSVAYRRFVVLFK